LPKSRDIDKHLSISEEKRHTIQTQLLAWYGQNKRDLPWRKNKDPYRIWVSEIMLQQTRVDTVIPYFERFMKLFPTVEDLANAPEEQVLKAWEGLGYYSRVRNLHQAAKQIVHEGDGKIPSDKKSILKLKGIGAYTAGAVLSIAFDQKIPAVDGNVMRVFSRLFAIEEDIASGTTRKKMESLVEKVMPEEAPGDFNQALMDLGATICTPVSPGCLLCPVRPVCEAYEKGMEEQLPVKKKAKPPVQQEMVMAFFQHQNLFIGEKRPEQGLLAGLWGLPTFEIPKGDQHLTIIEKFCKENQIPALNYIIKGEFQHIFSHRHWKVTVVEVELKHTGFDLPTSWSWLEKEKKDEKTWANVYHKAFETERKKV
jgi:A/G-specific adenine glycosylase